MNEIRDDDGLSRVRRDGMPVVFAQLDREWMAVAADTSSFLSLRAWAVAMPALDGFASLAELVATVRRMGDPDRSCRLLADLLVISDGDELATRAVLQAVAPGLRQAARRRWRLQIAGGPWRSADDLAAEAVSAGWAAIRLHAGQRHDRPAAVIVRAVEGRLRRTDAAWRKEAARSAVLRPGRDEPSHSGQDAAQSIEGQAAALIAGAVRAGVLDRTEARLILATGVLGCSVADAARTMGLEGDGAYRSVNRARETLRAWLRDTDGDTSNGLMARSEPSPRRSPFFPTPAPSRADADISPNAASTRSGDISMPPLLLTPLEAARLLGISRSKVYALMKTDEIAWVTIGACRRIPHGDLVDHVERLRRRHHEDGRHGS